GLQFRAVADVKLDQTVYEGLARVGRVIPCRLQTTIAEPEDRFLGHPEDRDPPDRSVTVDPTVDIPDLRMLSRLNAQHVFRIEAIVTILLLPVGLSMEPGQVALADGVTVFHEILLQR